MDMIRVCKESCGRFEKTVLLWRVEDAERNGQALSCLLREPVLGTKGGGAAGIHGRALSYPLREPGLET